MGIDKLAIKVKSRKIYFKIFPFTDLNTDIFKCGKNMYLKINIIIKL